MLAQIRLGDFASAKQQIHGPQADVSVTPYCFPSSFGRLAAPCDTDYCEMYTENRSSGAFMFYSF